MNGDENDNCMQFLRDMNVAEVPTFLFVRVKSMEDTWVLVKVSLLERSRNTREFKSHENASKMPSVAIEI